MIQTLQFLILLIVLAIGAVLSALCLGIGIMDCYRHHKIRQCGKLWAKKKLK